VSRVPSTARRVSWLELSARNRITALLDARSFEEFVGPQEGVTSPHLLRFDLPNAFDDGIVVGRGRLEGNPVLIAAQEGRFMGGSIGEVHGAKLVGILRAARALAASGRTQPCLLLLDTGGVRLQEANAGETAAAEAVRAVLDARSAGASVIALLGGRAGCFGGGSLIAACCSHVVMSEHARLGVSGPEVIETYKGAEEFDSQDRALAWRTLGGTTRRLLGSADALVDDTAAAFRQAVIAQLRRPRTFEVARLQAEHSRLRERIRRFGDCRDGSEIVRRLLEPAAVHGLDDGSAEDAERLIAKLPEAVHDAR
jgi:malonate decarboxylase beta subunit